MKLFKSLVAVVAVFAVFAAAQSSFAVQKKAPAKKPAKTEAAGEKVTLTGTVTVVKQGETVKSAELKTDEGNVYTIGSIKTINAALDGKKCDVTGTVKEKGGKKVLYVKTCAEAAAAPAK